MKMKMAGRSEIVDPNYSLTPFSHLRIRFQKWQKLKILLQNQGCHDFLKRKNQREKIGFKSDFFQRKNQIFIRFIKFIFLFFQSLFLQL